MVSFLCYTLQQVNWYSITAYRLWSQLNKKLEALRAFLIGFLKCAQYL